MWVKEATYLVGTQIGKNDNIILIFWSRNSRGSSEPGRRKNIQSLVSLDKGKGTLIPSHSLALVICKIETWIIIISCGSKKKRPTGVMWLLNSTVPLVKGIGCNLVKFCMCLFLFWKFNSESFTFIVRLAEMSFRTSALNAKFCDVLTWLKVKKKR